MEDKAKEQLAATDIEFYEPRTFKKNLKRFNIKPKRDLEPIFIPNIPNMIDEDWVRAREEAMSEEVWAIAMELYRENNKD